MNRAILILPLLLAATIAHADGSAIFLNANGNGTISSLQLRVIPGMTNATSFRVVAQGGNISSLGFFAFSPDLNITVSPANRTLLPDGDFQLVTVSVSVANNTQAGPKVASIFTITTKPEQLQLPLLVDVPSTTEWNITPGTILQNVSVNGYSQVNVTLVNTGNIQISGHVSKVDPHALIFLTTPISSLSPASH